MPERDGCLRCKDDNRRKMCTCLRKCGSRLCTGTPPGFSVLVCASCHKESKHRYNVRWTGRFWRAYRTSLGQYCHGCAEDKAKTWNERDAKP